MHLLFYLFGIFIEKQDNILTDLTRTVMNYDRVREDSDGMADFG